MGERFETATVHIGHSPLKQVTSKSTPIYQTSVFAFDGLEEVEKYYAGEGEYLYTRNGNPNQVELADAIARLEQAEAGVSAASGMGAIMAGLLSILSPGDHVLASHEIYGGTYALLHKELSRFGIELECIVLDQGTRLSDHVRPATKLFFLETITNPLLTVVDLPQWIRQAKELGLTVMVDNTFATPYLVQPIAFGADLVVHSGTKYIGGHSDVTCGVLVGNRALVKRAAEIVVNYGASLSPFEAWLTARGLKTLAVRMERQCDNAKEVARFLQSHPAVSRVYYPSDEATSFFTRQKQGAMVSFTLKEESKIYDFYRALDWIQFAPSLAGVETSVSHPVTTSHRAFTEEQRLATGITMGLVRMSVGIEAVDDIVSELSRALRN
ncbi:PLP-dependent aspartate aminotransferase family protein [Brevibacillus sp. FSL K6-0770]|uniref:trans-sulfuration enzyme family protein n=1 Tax=Brevibacillus sp. 1238 TaxID=2940565 RepID=UPI00156B7535|nr:MULTISPECIES: PLP-dependent aspartate aminotransferase family protein [Brevibacillus]MBU8711229.1 aminotransferase class V-fold PLP-dependent enzyme [Brevibacillus parabrevis]MDR4999597.1 PLP-dependent aspartate aminotransferase family protein [Brevibacillus parabrevis]MED2253841.1 PLP-dependent aspartate aminotransferase family protein [Brevibacillus parabrevis]UED71980.1 PLP-dependent aspartate aminotransferase family protein [Brevibacillus sp. HD3.3A]WDV98204.1 PLP-dependent aspartate am